MPTSSSHGSRWTYGCGPRFTRVALDEGSHRVRMAQNGLLDPQFQHCRYTFQCCISIAAQIGPKAEAQPQGDPSLAPQLFNSSPYLHQQALLKRPRHMFSSVQFSSVHVSVTMGKTWLIMVVGDLVVEAIVRHQLRITGRDE